MALHRHDVDRLLEPELVSGLADLALGDLRQRRDACQRAEVALSYVRRVLQGELDLVTAELDARHDGVRGDTGRLIDDLPSILAGPGAAAAGGEPGEASERGRAPRFSMAGTAEGLGHEDELDLDALVAEVLADGLPPGIELPAVLPGGNLGALGDDDLRAAAVWLGQAETAVSTTRRGLHDRIDQYQAAIVERYKVGAADVDTLLG